MSYVISCCVYCFFPRICHIQEKLKDQDDSTMLENKKIVKLIRDSIADPNRLIVTIASKKDENGLRSLEKMKNINKGELIYRAAQNGKEEFVFGMLKKNNDLKDRALAGAIRANESEFVKKLLTNGSNYLIGLKAAAFFGEKDMFSLIMSLRKKKLTDEEVEELVYFAAVSGQLDLLKMIIGEGKPNNKATANRIIDGKESALLYSFKNTQKEDVKEDFSTVCSMV